jgi:hypothetical protein
VRFIPLVGAPTTMVSLAFVPNARQLLVHKFVEAAVSAV